MINLYNFKLIILRYNVSQVIRNFTCIETNVDIYTYKKRLTEKCLIL